MAGRGGSRRMTEGKSSRGRSLQRLQPELHELFDLDERNLMLNGRIPMDTMRIKEHHMSLKTKKKDFSVRSLELDSDKKPASACAGTEMGMIVFQRCGAQRYISLG